MPSTFQDQTFMLIVLAAVVLLLSFFFLADLWYSLVSIWTYAAPLRLVRQSLRAQQGTDSAAVKQLQTAYSVTLGNLAATILAVTSTSCYYLFMLVFCSAE